MVSKLKAKFIPEDYELELFKKLSNLKQKEMFMKTYIEEFYKIHIRFGHCKSSKEKVPRYFNGLKFNVQDELIMLTLSLDEDAY